MGYFIAIQFGSDLNDPMIWFGLGLGLLMRRVKDLEAPVPERSAPSRLSLAQPAPAA
jgi:hypothetical protein